MKLQKIYLFVLSAICAQSGVMRGMETGLGKQETAVESSKDIWLSFNDETVMYITPIQWKSLFSVSRYLSKNNKESDESVLVPCSSETFKKMIGVVASGDAIDQLSDEDRAQVTIAAAKLGIIVPFSAIGAEAFKKLSMVQRERYVACWKDLCSRHYAYNDPIFKKGISSHSGKYPFEHRDDGLAYTINGIDGFTNQKDTYLIGSEYILNGRFVDGTRGTCCVRQKNIEDRSHWIVCDAGNLEDPEPLYEFKIDFKFEPQGEYKSPLYRFSFHKVKDKIYIIMRSACDEFQYFSIKDSVGTQEIQIAQNEPAVSFKGFMVPRSLVPYYDVNKNPQSGASPFIYRIIVIGDTVYFLGKDDINLCKSAKKLISASTGKVYWTIKDYEASSHDGEYISGLDRTIGFAKNTLQMYVAYRDGMRKIELPERVLSDHYYYFDSSDNIHIGPVTNDNNEKGEIFVGKQQLSDGELLRRWRETHKNDFTQMLSVEGLTPIS